MSLWSDIPTKLFVFYLLFALFRLFDDVLGGPHLCSSDMKSPRFKGKYSILYTVCLVL